jgi:hypothetical protein
MLRKRVFSQRNAKNVQCFHDDGVQNFEVIYEEGVRAHIQNQTKHDIETKNFNIFPLILREIDSEIMRFLAAKTQKMTNFFKT